MENSRPFIDGNQDSEGRMVVLFFKRMSVELRQADQVSDEEMLLDRGSMMMKVQVIVMHERGWKRKC